MRQLEIADLMTVPWFQAFLVDNPTRSGALRGGIHGCEHAKIPGEEAKLLIFLGRELLIRDSAVELIEYFLSLR